LATIGEGVVLISLGYAKKVIFYYASNWLNTTGN